MTRTAKRLRGLPVLVAVIGIIAAGIFWSQRASDPNRPAVPAAGTDVTGADAPAAPPRTVPDGEGAIEGTVTCAGRPVAARVEVRRLPGADASDPLSAPLAAGPPFAETGAAAEGTFRVAGLGPGRYDVRAIDAAGSRAEATATIPVAGARARVALRIPSGGLSFTGRATYEDGRPFTGLVLCGSRVRTDRNGRFRIAGLAPGVHGVVFLVPGLLRVEGHHACVPASGEIPFVIGTGDRPFSGRVVAAPDGSPVCGAVVMLKVGGIRQRVVTDAAGAFRATLPHGGASLTVDAEGYWRLRTWLPADLTDCEVTLDRTGRITGRVVTPKGEPVAGVGVFAVSADEPVQAHRFAVVRTVSDEEGRFVLSGVGVTDVAVFARGAGTVSLEFADAIRTGCNPLARTLPVGGETEVVLVVVPAVRAEGRVLDPEGKPVPGAVVSARPGFDDNRSRPQGPLGLAATETATGPDGEYRFPELLPGIAYRLSARAPGLLRGTAGISPAAPGATVTADIRFEPGRFVDVRAVEAGTRAPVVGALVQVTTEAAPAFRVEASALTDEAGRARLGPLSATPLRLRGRHPDHALPGPRLDLDVETNEGELSFLPGLPLAGRVVLPDGTPVPHGRLQTWPENSSGYGDRRRYCPLAAGGVFRLVGHPPGRYRVYADAGIGTPSFHRGEVLATAGTVDLVIRLDPVPPEPDDRRGLRIRVTGPDGKPVPYAKLTASELIVGEEELTRTWAGVHLGELFLDIDEASREVWIEVSQAASLAFAPLPFGPVLAGPFSPGDDPVEIRLPPEQSVSGVVLGLDGKGVPGAEVTAEPLRTLEEYDSEYGRVRTDGKGRFRIGRLGKGNYRIATRVGPDSTGVLTSAGANDVVLRLGSDRQIRVRVLDADANPAKRVHVSVRRAEFDSDGARLDTIAGGTTGPDGIAAFAGVAPGETYVLEVRRGWIDDFGGVVRIRDWVPADTDVVLPPELRVGGTVRGPTGGVVAGARVFARGSGTKWASVRTDEKGRFLLSPFLPGPVTLLALDGDSETAPSSVDARAMIVPAGKTDAILAKGPGARLRVRVGNRPPDVWCETRLVSAAGEVVGERPVDEEDRVLFDDLDPAGAYSLYVTTVSSGLTLFLPGLGPSEEEVVVTLAAGGIVRGQLDLAERTQRTCVWLEGPGFTLPGNMFPDGSFEVRYVPAGKFTLQVAGWRDRRWLRATAPSSAGDDLRLSLR